MKQKTRINEYGFLVNVLERLFFYFLWITPGTWLLSTRVKSQKELESNPKPEETARKRARKADFYIISWFFILLFCELISTIPKTITILLSSILPLWRAFEIFVYAVNVTIFDPLRLKKPVKYISTIERNLILGLWNYIELFLCFSVVYSARINLLEKSKSLFDAFYFSMITQLTIGYGDVLPIGYFKFVAMTQGIVSFIFVLLILSRFVSLLPDIRHNIKENMEK